MKTLLLAASLLIATAAVAAPAPNAAPDPTPNVAPATYDELTQTAGVQFAAQDFGNAQKSLEAAFALAQTNDEKSEVLTQLGMLFDNQHRYVEALQTYQRILPLVVNSPDELQMTRLFIAQNYVEQKKWQEAADAWAQLMKSTASPQIKVTFQLALAQAYSEMKQPAKAREQLGLLRAQMASIIADTKAQSDDARGFAFIIVGRSYQTENNFDAARQSFEAATAIAGSSTDLQVNAFKSLAEVAQKQGRTTDVEVAFTNARQLVINQASQQFASRSWADAVESYREAAQIGTPDAFTAMSLHWQLGNALKEMGDIDAARVEFGSVIDTVPDTTKPMFTSLLAIFKPFSYQYLAEGYIAQGKFELARAALKDELAIVDLQAPIRQKAEELLKGLG